MTNDSVNRREEHCPQEANFSPTEVKVLVGDVRNLMGIRCVIILSSGRESHSSS